MLMKITMQKTTMMMMAVCNSRTYAARNKARCPGTSADAVEVSLPELHGWDIVGFLTRHQTVIAKVSTETRQGAIFRGVQVWALDLWNPYV